MDGMVGPAVGGVGVVEQSVETARMQRHPCNLCGCDPCESPGACRAQARAEDGAEDAEAAGDCDAA